MDFKDSYAILTEFCNKGTGEHTSLMLYEDDGIHPSIVQEIVFYV